MKNWLALLLEWVSAVKNKQKNMSSVTLLWIVVAGNLVLFHWPLFKFISSEINLLGFNGVQTLITVLMVIVLFSIIVFVPLLLISRRLFKFILYILLLCNSLALYFMVTYQVILDRTMIGNILNTDQNEAAELFHVNLLFYVFFFACVPVYWIWQAEIKKHSRRKLIIHFICAFFICLGWIYYFSNTWLWVDKHAKHLGAKILPWGYVINTVRYWQHLEQENQTQLPLTDLRVVDPSSVVVALVIGETARAKNFAFYGYERNTHPLLSATDIIPMNKPVACSTYTTASLRCMLSHEDPDQLDAIYEYLPSYLKRHDVDVIWRTNNWGEPPINATSYTKAATLREHCEGETCHLDDVMHLGLAERIRLSQHKKVFVVLHQKGSHGPLYSKRYAAKHEVFTPVCTTVNLNECTKEALQNAYDNSLLNTDQFLYEVINLLKDTGVPSVMIYMSDHGESLGENGLYLHGTPYSLAPDEQKEVPMLIWMSPSFKQHKKLQGKDINWRSNHGHNLVFHSVVGALGFADGAYDASNDIFFLDKL